MSSNDENANGQAIETPHDNDILSGRGNFVNYHPGNEQFRALVRKHKVAYVACPKSMKGTFAEMIVEEIKRLNPPGRFLKQDDTTKLWYDIGEKKALDKTRQALREGAPEIQKEISGDDIATIPVVTKKEPERRVVDASFDVVSSGRQNSQERRASDFVANPQYNFGKDTPNFVTSNSESFHPVPSQMLPQQTMSLQSTMISQVMHQDDSDPYCSSLPPEHYESFKLPTMNHTMGISHPMNSYNPSLAMQSDSNGFATYNNEINYFPTFGNPTTSMKTINESKGHGFRTDTGFYPQDQQYNIPNSQFNGSCGQKEYSLPQPITSSNPNNNNSYSMQHAQPTTSLMNGQRRLNKSINTQNRTYNVRPQPIQLCSSDQGAPFTTVVSQTLNDVSEKATSFPYKDVPQAAPKSILRSVTPRRMIINVHQPTSRSITPRRMDATVPEVTPLRGSPPRNSRSRLRARRDDSNRSMASTNSIAFEKIFADFSDEGPLYKSKNANSGASFLSVMSLSINDVMLPVDEAETDSQGQLLDASSEKICTQSIETISATSASTKRVPPKRNGSSDIMNVERGVYEMSVNTISIDDSDVASSQDDMSFLHVFDDQKY